MDYKYTPDGKKVVVIGALNSKETIVQEIYVVDGSEIPAGEHFVAKSLLDAPAETWKSREEIRISEALEKKNAELQALKQEVSQFTENCVKAMKAKLEWINGITEPEVKKIIEMITNYITGVYTHVVYQRGYEYIIKEWTPDLFTNTEWTSYDSNRRFESVRLVSIFGHWNQRRALDWKVNQYSDGSGHDMIFTPCKSYEEARDVVAKLINSRNELSNTDYNTCVKYNIPVDYEKNERRIKTHNDNVLKNIAENEKKIADLRNEIIC